MKNLKYALADRMEVTPLVKAIAQTASRTSNGALSGDPVIIGTEPAGIPGVAVKDADSAQLVSVATKGIFEVLVAGIDNSGGSNADANVIVIAGAQIYFHRGDTPPLSLRANDGTPWGKAFGASGTTLVAAGATTTKINVKVGA